MIKFINIFSKKIVLFFFGAFTLLYVIGNIFFTVRMENELISNLVSFNNGITIVNILFLFVLLFLTYYLIKKTSSILKISIFYQYFYWYLLLLALHGYLLMTLN